MPKTIVRVEEAVRERECGSFEDMPSDSYDSGRYRSYECPSEDEQWCNTYIDPCTGESVKEEYTKTYEVTCGQKYEVEKCVVTRKPAVTRPCSPPPPRKRFYRPPPTYCKPCCKRSLSPCPPQVRRGCNSPPRVPLNGQLTQVESKLGKLDCRFRNVEKALQDAIIALGRIR